MFKVLVILDKYGWAYHTIARGIIDYNRRDDLIFDIVSENEDMDFIIRRHDSYDLVFAFGWTTLLSNKKKDLYREKLPFLDKTRLITGIHSHRSWDGYASQPDYCPPPPPALITRLSQYKGVNIISRRLYRLFRTAGLDNAMLTENGVDTDLFRPVSTIRNDRSKPLVVGFSGSKEIGKHDHLKGFSEFILPLGEVLNVRVRVLGGRGENQVERSGMPALYNDIDLYICASSSEGFSQSVLEAAACGRGILSTRVGGCEDLIVPHYNGLFIERDREQIQCLVSKLEADRDFVKRLGENNRKRLLNHYSWSVRAGDWLAFIENNLPTTETGKAARA